ncbi:MAG: monovalent cation/H(+) antiporter subunit G [Bacillota bacterium]
MLSLIRDILVLILLFGGLFFLVVGVVGLIRLPDIYNRLHALGKCDTMGSGLIILAMVLIVPGMTNIIKLLLMEVFILAINPVMTHLITKTAYVRGTPMADDSFVINAYYEEDEDEGELYRGEGGY